VMSVPVSKLALHETIRDTKSSDRLFTGANLSSSVGEEEDGGVGTRRVFIAAMVGGATAMLIMLLRTVVRTRDGIAGGAFRDCLVAVFCPGCGLCQLARHEGLVRGKYGGLLSPTGEKRARVEALEV
jgi:Cys-rich protein (TIGR01571 family)